MSENFSSWKKTLDDLTARRTSVPSLNLDQRKISHIQRIKALCTLQTKEVNEKRVYNADLVAEVKLYYLPVCMQCVIVYSPHYNYSLIAVQLLQLQFLGDTLPFRGLFVCLSRSCIVLKRQKISTQFLLHMTALTSLPDHPKIWFTSVYPFPCSVETDDGVLLLG